MTYPDFICDIYIEQRGKGRPVFSRASGSARTPETTRAWESEAAYQMRVEFGDRQPLDLEHPCWAVEVVAFHPRPKSRPKWMDKDIWKASDHSYYAPGITRHDLDNIVKITLDAMQIARIVENDRCIVAIAARSWFTWTGERPRVRVTMTKVHP